MQKSYNIDKVICIEIGVLNQIQIFAISEKYKIDFESLIEIKNTNTEFVWIELVGDGNSNTVGWGSHKYIRLNLCYTPITKREYSPLKRLEAIKIPSIKSDDDTLGAYVHYLKMGFDIKNKMLDKEIMRIDATLLQSNTEAIEFESYLNRSRVILDLDIILDKISEFGIKSLDKIEMEYLDTLSKNKS
jgi:hypothetical protein